MDPNCYDGWKRRGQVRAALGYDKDAINDLTMAVTALGDFESHHQRGIIYHKLVALRAFLILILIA